MIEGGEGKDEGEKRRLMGLEERVEEQRGLERVEKSVLKLLNSIEPRERERERGGKSERGLEIPS